MNWFAFHLASGLSLFSGSALVCGGVLLTSCMKGRLSKLARGLAGSLGVLLIVLSSSPFPSWVYGLLLVVAAGWSGLEVAPSLRWPRSRRWFRWAFPLFCLLLSALELPHHLKPRLPEGSHDRLSVIGDSLSAGLDNRLPPWPALLAARRKITVINLAQPGATLSSAKRQATRLRAGDSLVLLEIGGNDLLGTPTPAEFERDLRELLRTVCQPKRVVVLLELPLLPLQARYGSIQRTLAAAQGVSLIPKRFLARVLGAPGATVDGLHLSATGSQLMAETMGEALGGLLTGKVTPAPVGELP